MGSPPRPSTIKSRSAKTIVQKSQIQLHVQRPTRSFTSSTSPVQSSPVQPTQSHRPPAAFASDTLPTLPDSRIAGRRFFSDLVDTCLPTLVLHLLAHLNLKYRIFQLPTTDIRSWAATCS